MATTEIATAKLPVSICRGPVRFGDVTLDAHVLDDETRLISQRGVVAALTGGVGSGGLQRYIDRIPNKPADFSLVPIPFRVAGGTNGNGVDAMQFIRIVKLYADAWARDELHELQRPIGERCHKILFAMAGIGIVAMIDEATGYRARNYAQEIERKIATYLLPSPSEWERMYPADFFTLLHRLFGYEREGSKNHGFVRWFIHEYVYSFLDKDVAAAVKQRNPNPRFGSNHHQHYADRARALLNAHIARLMTVMRQSSNKGDFYMRFACEFKGGGLQLSLPAKTN